MTLTTMLEVELPDGMILTVQTDIPVRSCCGVQWTDYDSPGSPPSMSVGPVTFDIKAAVAQYRKDVAALDDSEKPPTPADIPQFIRNAVQSAAERWAEARV